MQLNDLTTCGGLFTDETGKPLAGGLLACYLPGSSIFKALYAEDGECIAHFLDNGSCALNLKWTDGFTSIYCGTKYLSADVVKEIARFAGCHIYIDTEDVLYANRDYITLHASSSGRKVIRLPRKASAYELYEEKYYSKNSDVIDLDALKGETYMFELK